MTQGQHPLRSWGVEELNATDRFTAFCVEPYEAEEPSAAQPPLHTREFATHHPFLTNRLLGRAPSRVQSGANLPHRQNGIPVV